MALILNTGQNSYKSDLEGLFELVDASDDSRERATTLIFDCGAPPVHVASLLALASSAWASLRAVTLPPQMPRKSTWLICSLARTSNATVRSVEISSLQALMIMLLQSFW